MPEELTGAEGGIEPGVRESFEATLELAERLGATVEPCRLPHAPHALSAYYLIAPAEASANLARFDGVRYGLRVDGDADLIDDVQPHPRGRASDPRSSGGSCSAPTRCRAATTTPTTGPRRRSAPRSPRTSARRSSAFDFVVTPTSPWTAFELGAKTDDPLAMYLNDFCTVPMPLAGIPAISIPSGLSATGLPVGFQLAGPAFSESRLLDAAYALERAIGFDGSRAHGDERERTTSSTSRSSAWRSTSS